MFCAQVSNVEQDVACGAGTLGGHFEAVRALADNPHVADEDWFATAEACPTGVA